MDPETILVETDLFEHREVKPHFINPCCFGEDFAEWLRQELSKRIGSSFGVSEIIQEDWGWCFWARRGKDPFLVCVGLVESESLEDLARWMILVECDYGLNIFKKLFSSPDPNVLATLRMSVREAIASNRSIKIIENEPL